MRLTTGHWVEKTSVQTVQSDQPVHRCVAKAATLLLQATLSCCAASHLATGHWVENKSVQSVQPVPRCNGKAVTLCSMRLATVTAKRFRGAQLRTDPAKREGTENYPDGRREPAQRDEIPIPPSGRGICAQTDSPFLLLACGLLLAACCCFAGVGDRGPRQARFWLAGVGETWQSGPTVWHSCLFQVFRLVACRLLLVAGFLTRHSPP